MRGLFAARTEFESKVRTSTILIVAAIGAYLGLFALVKTQRSAAFDLAVTLRAQRDEIRPSAGSWPRCRGPAFRRRVD